MNEVIGSETTRQGRLRALVAFALVVGAAVVGFSGDPASAAGVPAFPDNLVIFPDRDFLSAEGFDGHVGENALVQVFRGGEVVGAAEVTLVPGGVPFEVNHPGGYCWGNDVVGGSGFLSGEAAAGSLPDVTPDIRPNDDIRVTFADGTTSEITTQDAYVADPPENGTNLPAVSGVDTVRADDPDFIAGFESRFTIRGRIATADPTFVEQRIVNPDLTDTAVGRRDVRAVPDPAGFLPDGNDTYMSRLVVDDVNDTFVATYLFRDPNIATTAATGGGVRLLTWQATDLNANRQGITIAEFGEPGGPGFGGCPNGPLQSGPPGPTDVQAGTSTGVTQVTVTWVPATPIPGTPPITGYRVHAVETTTGQVEQAELGRRINDPLATGTTITGLDVNKTYAVQVVSVSDVGETFPAVHATFDTTPPVLSAEPPAGTYRGAQQVTLSSDEPGEIWYTVDGSAVLDAAGDVMPGIPGVSGAQRYDAPITVDADTTVNAAAFDLYGNSSTASFAYVITSTPLTPTLSGQAGIRSIDLSWDSTVDPTITQYTVTLYDAPSDGAIVDRRVILSTEVPNDSATFVSLTEGTDYWATIVAENLSGASPESARLGPLTPYGSFVANAGADQTVVRGSAVHLDGSASIGATAYSWAADDPAVVLDDSTSATPSFTFPATSVGPVTLELTITDSSGAASTDTVTITAEDVVANAGIAQTVVRGSSVTLDGTGSTPSANLSYSWVSLDPTVLLSGSTSATPSFTFPSTSRGPLTFELTVTDLSGTAAKDTVTITAEDVVANAGADQTVVRGSSVTLDGTGSTPSANLSYSWVSLDPTVLLSGSTSATPSFTFPSTSPGPLTFELTVTDQSGASATDSVTVSASNNDPLAVARAEYRTSKNEWRFDGVATVLVDNTITIRLNHYTNSTLDSTTQLSTGIVSVDAAGVWTVRYNPPPGAERPTGTGSYTITVTSSQGGLLLNEPISIRR